MIHLLDTGRLLKLLCAWQSVVHLRMETRNNLEILRCISILAIRRDLRFLSTTLLLCLSDLDPLLCCEMLAKVRKDVFGESKLIKHRTVLDRVEDNMIVRSIKSACNSPRTRNISTWKWIYSLPREI